ncbi:MAG: hypothetical protein II961_04085 [Candidatus Riflebacteria bacterium]|nr:hypothetical protein [Candidatus Riflebacteria bacterium]
MISAPNNLPPKKAVLDGNSQIEITIDVPTSSDELKKVEQVKKFSPERVFLNTSPYEVLITCPGIGPKTATRIIEERQISQFDDWRNFRDRITGISTLQIEALKQSGVRLFPPKDNADL